MFGGLAAYFWLREETPVALGMQDVRLIVAICGAGMAVISLIGMFATAEDSRVLARLYTLVVVGLMVLQGFTSIYFMFMSFENRLKAAFFSLAPEVRHALEVRVIRNVG
jgi:hypothetical protein